MAITRPRATTGARPWPYTPECSGMAPAAMPGLQLLTEVLQMSLDAMRSQHARAVHAGLMANSILESRDFEKRVDALEHTCLGRFARHN